MPVEVVKKQMSTISKSNKRRQGHIYSRIDDTVLDKNPRHWKMIVEHIPNHKVKGKQKYISRTSHVPA